MLAIVDRDLADAGGNISPDWRFGIAYNGALKLCTIHDEGNVGRFVTGTATETQRLVPTADGKEEDHVYQSHNRQECDPLIRHKGG